MLGQDVGGDFDPSSLVNVGIGGVLVLLAGRLMSRLWGSWSDYATQVNTRGTVNEERADAMSKELSTVLSEVGGLRVENMYLKEDVAERDEIIVKLRAQISRMGGDPEH